MLFHNFCPSRLIIIVQMFLALFKMLTGLVTHLRAKLWSVTLATFYYAFPLCRAHSILCLIVDLIAYIFCNYAPRFFLYFLLGKVFTNNHPILNHLTNSLVLPIIPSNLYTKHSLSK